MDYFLIKQSGTVFVPKAAGPEASSPEEPSVRIAEDLSSMSKYDYIASGQLISDQLKQLLKQYLPEQLWRPCGISQKNHLAFSASGIRKGQFFQSFICLLRKAFCDGASAAWSWYVLQMYSV